MSMFSFSINSGQTNDDLDEFTYSGLGASYNSEKLEPLDEFQMSTLSTRTKSETPGNQLVVVVTKAQDLPNRRKLDKQSPYVVLRIQDQVQRTKVVPRGGQTPHFDGELWFTLDNVEETVLNLIIYHQQKKESELVCSAKIDFSTALRRSVKEGYDGWFELEYNNKPAGKIYLEMTYYPSVTSVPTAVDNVSRDKRMRTLMKAANGVKQEGFRPHMSMISAVHSDLPDLPDLEAEYEDRLRSSVGSSVGSSAMSSQTSFETHHELPLPKEEKALSPPRSFLNEAHGQSETDKGWMSKFLENAYNLNKNMPSLFSKKQILLTPNGNEQTQAKTFGLEPPTHRLFADSSDEESENEEYQSNAEQSMKSSCRSQSQPQSNPNAPKPSKYFNDTEVDSSDDEFEVGQRVEFKSSITSREFKSSAGSRIDFRSSLGSNTSPSRKTRSPLSMLNDPDSDSASDSDLEADTEDVEASMRASFKNKPLPTIKITKNENPLHLSREQITIPPRPPSHSGSGSSFRSSSSSMFDSQTPSQPKWKRASNKLRDSFNIDDSKSSIGFEEEIETRPNRSTFDFLSNEARNAFVSKAGRNPKDKVLSYSEIRKLRLRG